MDYKVTIKLQENKEHLKAYADVLLDEAYMIKGLTVVDGKNGLFINMPQKQGADEKYYDQFYPVTKESREALTKAVIDEYQHQISKTQTFESKKETEQSVEPEQKQEEPASEPKATRGRKAKEPEPEAEEEMGMAM